MRMHMLRVVHRMAHLDLGDPRVLHHVLDAYPLLRVRLQHAPDQAAAGARGEVVDRRRALSLRRRRAGGGVGEVQGVGGLGDAPGDLGEVEAVVDDTAGPDVDEAGIVGW